MVLKQETAPFQATQASLINAEMISFLGIVLLCLGILPCSIPSVSADERDDQFENQIRPVLAATCFGCHGDPKVSGELRVDSREALLSGGDSGPSIVPGSPETSLLMKAIQRHDDVSAMPPDNDKALRPEQLAAFEKWIREGAYWPATVAPFERAEHWAFKPMETQDPPQVPSTKNAIDAFIRAKQSAAEASHAPQADKIALIRRATFDLTGLPPTVEEIQDFAMDHSDDAFAKVVDRLLASQEYGRRWGRHWLDVVRYADTAGETADYPVPLAWRYRNYVIDSFNADKPYDQFIQEQIAGDVFADLAPRDRYAEQVTATGYLAISRRFGFDSENYHHLTIQDTIDNLGQTVLGLSLGCARCHDHKFDPVSMQDYYGLYGIFDSSRYSFPGSEQKQKTRSMVPLLPPDEATPKWRAFDQRVATLATSLENRKQPTPAAILRSLQDMDGDFEMQAPAAGGSNGVLVSPWLYAGKIAVTNAAQSPFKNLYARGKVGASIPADGGKYRIAQSVYPHRTPTTCPSVYVNLDFRVEANSKATGVHRFWIGSLDRGPALLVHVGAETVSLQRGEKSETIGKIESNQWHNLQLQWDWVEGVVDSTLTSGGASHKVAFADMTATNGAIAIDGVVLECDSELAAPAIEYDNLGVQDNALSPATVDVTRDDQNQDKIDLVDLERQFSDLVGMGGDFELQTEGQPPEKPWNPGPNSVVRIASRAQSEFTNVFPLGGLGVHMPNRAEYDGFGLTLPMPWTLKTSEQLFATFDMRIADVTNGSDGSWRFYIGHGPGNSAAVELFFNGKQFFHRSGDSRDPVQPLAFGAWNQIQLTLDLRSKRYQGVLRAGPSSIPFEGDFASGWDGTVDYSFIDSYGHLGGVRPAIDVDNYEIRSSRFDNDSQPSLLSSASGVSEKIERVNDLKNKMTAIRSKISGEMEELNRLLVEGPFEMAYGVTEGTPHSVPIQLRGEPTLAGDMVPRGFLQVLGQETLPPEAAGSGRMQLARWLTRSDNPLTARVMVNRIWQYHFGTGLVKTPNDFGLRGLAPTHPELLDYLATEFVRARWSVKSMHRMIMLSETYQQSSTSPTSESDVRNLYTHFARRRLSAEEIRDAILMVSGELDRETGKDHPFPSPISWGFSQHGPFNAVYDHNKRSVFLMTQRLKRHPYLALFDGPDPNASTADRMGTTVPTQALYFLNDSFVYAKSEAWARRILGRQESPVPNIEMAYTMAFGRSPTALEQRHASKFLDAYKAELSSIAKDNLGVASLAAFLRTLLASNEFLYLD